jgi:hypothetical protein
MYVLRIPRVAADAHDVAGVGEREWLYRCAFDVDALEDTGDVRHELVFEGLDTVCDVYLVCLSSCLLCLLVIGCYAERRTHPASRQPTSRIYRSPFSPPFPVHFSPRYRSASQRSRSNPRTTRCSCTSSPPRSWQSSSRRSTARSARARRTSATRAASMYARRSTTGGTHVSVSFRCSRVETDVVSSWDWVRAGAPRPNPLLSCCRAPSS